MNSHVSVASCYDTRYITSANNFVNAPHNTHHDYEYCGQEPMHVVNSSSFDATSNIQHVNRYSSAISSQHMVSPQDMPMNERIGYNNANYLANCSQNSAPHANPPIHNLASCVTPNSSRINKNLARWSSSKSGSTKVVHHKTTIITLIIILQVI